MEHDHDHHHHEQPASLKNLLFAIVINGGIVVFEMAFGLMIQSMALISDAVHNLSDIVHMLFSYWAEKVARRPATSVKTYGYRKIEFIAAFVNSIGLSVVIAFISWQSLQRLASPAEIPGREMLLVSVVAFFGNGAATLLLQRISARNINMKSAWLHSLQDTLFTLGVIVGALLIILFGWRLIDPLLSLAICLVIAREIAKIVRQAVNSLLDAVPPGIDFIEVRNDLLALDGVLEVNDLHIWQTGAGQKLLSAHLVSKPDSDSEAIIRSAQEILLHRYGINHTTLQLLPASAEAMEHCNHCNWGKREEQNGSTDYRTPPVIGRAEIRLQVHEVDDIHHERLMNSKFPVFTKNRKKDTQQDNRGIIPPKKKLITDNGQAQGH